MKPSTLWVVGVAVLLFANLLSAVDAATEYEYNIIPYETSWQVSDPEGNNFQNFFEIKLPNGDVYGSYSVLLPNNEIHTTTYNVTGNKGYRQTRSIVKINPLCL
ncbi:uncharacterized protein LOC135211439 [Macrobrachium nipponense]|uniref:uncharacterized protein LOC135211439 n=1 Tax=Macrobrachium nipponense TaxID=159736 RepID=UPI0030C7EC46